MKALRFGPPRLATVALLLAGALSLPAPAREIDPPEEIIVRYKAGIGRFADHGPVARRLDGRTEVVRLDARPVPRNARWSRLQARLSRIRADRNVLYAEPNWHGRFEEVPAPAPGDPGYANQWWLPAVGDRALWAYGRGEGTVVAVIDSGVDLGHPDLMPNLLAGGYNFGDDNARPQDRNGHGTRVAGIIAAAQDNGVGVSGLAPRAGLLPIKINAADSGTFLSDRLAAAIDHAVRRGATVINLSLTVDRETQTVADAIRRALAAGVTVVASAGNQGGPVDFPANLAGVVAVAATDETGALAGFSNRGPEVALAAPGVQITTTDLGGGLIRVSSGTSFAAPMVSAALAALASINPFLPADRRLAWLRAASAPLAGSAFGRLDAGAAGKGLVPHLLPGRSRYARADAATIGYTLPPTGAAVDIYVAVQTPLGEFSLGPDGGWQAVALYGYRALARGYAAEGTVGGTLFGGGGAFAPLPLAGLPAGHYVWRSALIEPVSGRLLGGVVSSVMEVQ